jgi:hypothetical protein
MKYRILLTTGACVCLLSVTAQQRSSKAFAITSADKGTFQWTDVKLIDVTTGEVVRSVFDSKQPNAAFFSARSGKAIKNDPALQADKNNQAFSSMSAACAYDARHNRLYYTPMFVNELRYIDLSARSPKVYAFNAEAFSKSNTLNNEANHITRMTIGADGNGYALSNDGNHLVRFTTGRKPVITDLGAVQDDPSNGPVSIHAKATSWGGDMVADASGNLYLFTAFQQVFKVNIQTRTATYITKMKG